MLMFRSAKRQVAVCALFVALVLIGSRPSPAAEAGRHTRVHPAQGVVTTVWQESNVLLEGEPLVIHYKVTNDSNEAQSVLLNTREQNWLSVHLFEGGSGEASNSTGKAVPLQASEVSIDFQRKTPGLKGSINEMIVGPHGSREGLYILRLNTDTKTSIPAGTYRLLLRGNLPVSSDDNPAKGYTDRRNWAFRFAVKPFDAATAETKVKALLLTARTGDEADASNTMDVLTAFPSRYAHAAWVELAKDGKLSPIKKGAFVGGFMRAHTEDAVAFLGEMTWKLKVLDCRGILSGLHFYGAAATKKQIEDLFTSNGDKLPSVPHINAD